MKKLLIIIIVGCLLAFRADTKIIKIELSVLEINMIIEGLKKSRIESWQSTELIDKIIKQANPQLTDSTKR